jgi:hypothetical protein
MGQLVAIEQAVGKAADFTIHCMILEAEECLLDLQREWLALPYEIQ